MGRLVFILLLLMLPVFIRGRENPQVKKQPVTLRLDSSNVEMRQFNDTALKEYSSQPEFRYTDEDIADDSLWTRFWRWVWRLINTATSGKTSSIFFKYLLVVLGISVLVFTVLKLLGMDMQRIFSRQPKPVEVPYNESLENIHEINFDNEIERAVNSHNYRLAVRLMYLKCLKGLDNSGIISWQPDKTNATYISEIANPLKQQKFSQLTRQFEYIWYGNFPLNSTGFLRISSSFHDFNRNAS